MPLGGFRGKSDSCSVFRSSCCSNRTGGSMGKLAAEGKLARLICRSSGGSISQGSWEGAVQGMAVWVGNDHGVCWGGRKEDAGSRLPGLPAYWVFLCLQGRWSWVCNSQKVEKMGKSLWLRLKVVIVGKHTEKLAPTGPFRGQRAGAAVDIGWESACRGGDSRKERRVACS